MKALKDLNLFARAAQSRSLSEAARAMNVSPAVISASLKRLEAELGVALFIRSTRSLRLSSDGETFYRHCLQGLEALALAKEALSADSVGVRGTLSLSVPSDLGRNLVVKWLHTFRLRHPQVEVRLQISDRVAGLFKEQIDVALRYGEVRSSSAVSFPVLATNRRVLCAAPSYIRRHGAPGSPADLEKHNCLSFQLSERAHDRWRFTRGAENASIRVQGTFQCDDGDGVRRLAVLGEGIAYKSHLDVLLDLAEGRLVQLCPEWTGEPAPLHLVYPDRRVIKPLVRLMRAHIINEVGLHIKAVGRSFP